jgi:uncharacterized protein YjcR
MSAKLYDHDAVLRDWLAGLSGQELTDKYGCPSNLGAVIAKRRGVQRSPEVMKLANKRRRQLTAESVKASPAGKRLEKRNQRIADHAKCHDIKRTAEKFGLSESRVREIAKQNGWQPNPPFDIEAILRDYLSGMKLFDIASKYGCTISYPTQLARRAAKKREPGVRAKRSKRV